MRIISGSARGRVLASFKGKEIRPTSDRVREAVFSSIYSQFGPFTGKRVLDLFAGTGAMAIEALSRGAESAVLVDQGRESASLVDKNLESTGLKSRGRFVAGTVPKVYAQLKAGAPFDIIFLDPPYAAEGIETMLAELINCGLLASDGMICLETARENLLPEKINSLRCYDRRIYGATAISYYRPDCDRQEES